MTAGMIEAKVGGQRSRLSRELAREILTVAYLAARHLGVEYRLPLAEDDMDPGLLQEAIDDDMVGRYSFRLAGKKVEIGYVRLNRLVWLDGLSIEELCDAYVDQIRGNGKPETHG